MPSRDTIRYRTKKRLITALFLSMLVSGCDGSTSVPWDRPFYLREWETAMLSSIAERDRGSIETAILQGQIALDNSRHLGADYHYPLSCLHMARLCLETEDDARAAALFEDTVSGIGEIIDTANLELEKLLLESRARANRGLALIAYDDRKYREAASKLDEAVQDIRRALSLKTSPVEDRFLMQRLSSALGSLARCYENQRLYKKAAQVYRESILISHISLAPEEDTKRLKESLEKIAARGQVSIDPQILAEHPPWISNLLKARSCLKERKYARSISYCQKAIGIAKNNRLDAVFMAFAYDNLARAQLFAQQNAAASQSYQKALQFREQVFDKNNPGIDWTLRQIATAATRAGDYRTAEKCLLRVLDLRRGEHGHDSIQLAKPLVKLSDLYSTINDATRANSTADRVFDIVRRKNVVNVETLQLVANLQFRLGNLEEARSLYERIFRAAGKGELRHYRDFIPLFEYRAVLKRMENLSNDWKDVSALIETNLKNASPRHRFLVVRKLSQEAEWLLSQGRSVEARILYESIISIGKPRNNRAGSNKIEVKIKEYRESALKALKHI